MKKREWIVGILGIASLMALMLYYQVFHVLKPVEDSIVVEEDTAEVLEGYKEAEEAVAYLMAQIQEEDLEGALRSCAIEELAAYFNMTLYLNSTEEFLGTYMIPLADSDDPAYYNISRIRLSADYGNLIQQCIERLASGHTLEVYKIAKDEPENPDGMYFQRLEKISNILGARDVCECTVYMKVDDMPLELHLSLAKYKKYWKVILFSPMSEYGTAEADIRDSVEAMDNVPLNLLDDQQVLLPMNYILVNSRKSEDPEKLVEDIRMYLQRGDVLSVLAYYDLGNAGEEPELSLDLLNRQKEASIQLQAFYYRIFLNKTDFAWVGRHYYDQPEYLPELLRVTNMQYVDYYVQQILQEDEKTVIYQIGYVYDEEWFTNNVILGRENGWNIRGME